MKEEAVKDNWVIVAAFVAGFLCFYVEVIRDNRRAR